MAERTDHEVTTATRDILSAVQAGKEEQDTMLAEKLVTTNGRAYDTV